MDAFAVLVENEKGVADRGRRVGRRGACLEGLLDAAAAYVLRGLESATGAGGKPRLEPPAAAAASARRQPPRGVVPSGEERGEDQEGQRAIENP